MSPSFYPSKQQTFCVVPTWHDEVVPAHGIVGIKLGITRLEGKRKLSQNRSAADVDGVISGLSEGLSAERAVAEATSRAAVR